MPTTVVEALIEALPYVQTWSGRVVVVKYGGSAMTAPALAEAVTEDLVLLRAVGVKVVLVHGGGKQVSALGARLGLAPRFVDGLRVTDDETMRLAQQVQIGGISRDIVAAIGRRGGQALGVSGHDFGGWMRAVPLQYNEKATGAPVDLGRVGQMTAVRADVLDGILDDGLIPVIAPVAVDDRFGSLNINADSMATAVAGAIGAARLIFLTDVDGIRGADGQPARELTASALQAWIDDGTIHGGMLPKAQACLSALSAGVDRVTVADGRVPHALLVELLTDTGVGTLIRSDDP
ncbi:MAG: acetylglutamate kinase [Myxococcota bacterium]